MTAMAAALVPPVETPHQSAAHTISKKPLTPKQSKARAKAKQAKRARKKNR